ncbi:MAG: tRNA (adenosine(37)-N6)-dimethylallyltransferase MiaA [Chitinivibrionales bacterium]|nr:tRNA (adenosine(37)-N6)-dimethylallyltransferase MiaA [Chitinivibrionales bacterium]
MPIKVPVLIGPTAVGKTDICCRLAEEFSGEIVSCDSGQIYRSMDIGTAKPSPEQLVRIKHWLIDIKSPSETYSAYQFTQDSLTIFRERSLHKRPLFLCGGSPFYYQSLHDGLPSVVAATPQFRQQCSRRIATEGKEVLYQELCRCDPESARRIHCHDIQRVIRALEVYTTQGVPLSAYTQAAAQRASDLQFDTILLIRPRDELYRRINQRVDVMIHHGLVDEVARLLAAGYGPSDPGMRRVGYTELFNVLSGHCLLNDAVEQIKTHTRNFAKRQMTWFTNKTKAVTIDVTDPASYGVIIERIKRFLDTDGFLAQV